MTKSKAVNSGAPSKEVTKEVIRRTGLGGHRWVCNAYLKHENERQAVLEQKLETKKASLEASGGRGVLLANEIDELIVATEVNRVIMERERVALKNGIEAKISPGKEDVFDMLEKGSQVEVAPPGCVPEKDGGDEGIVESKTEEGVEVYIKRTEDSIRLSASGVLRRVRLLEESPDLGEIPN